MGSVLVRKQIFSFSIENQKKKQTKELIAEIELLEEEVANREQHVLSLYRGIFENCVSRPPSEQNSSMTSPAHPKHESRKHPSIISSAFCSSKKFPFRPLQALVSIDGSGKRSTKTGRVHLSNGRNDTDSVKSCSGSKKVRFMHYSSSISNVCLHTLVTFYYREIAV